MSSQIKVSTLFFFVCSYINLKSSLTEIRDPLVILCFSSSISLTELLSVPLLNPYGCQAPSPEPPYRSLYLQVPLSGPSWTSGAEVQQARTEKQSRRGTVVPVGWGPKSEPPRMKNEGRRDDLGTHLNWRVAIETLLAHFFGLGGNPTGTDWTQHECDTAGKEKL